MRERGGRKGGREGGEVQRHRGTEGQRDRETERVSFIMRSGKNLFKRRNSV